MNERKRQVLASAQRLFIEKGFATTSIQDILNESKISKGTFYNYFSSKNECLMAILELGREETMIRRRELLIGQSSSNKKVLAEQISTRYEVNRDHNLFPILEAIFHSGDPDLRAFVKQHHYAELSWLADRLVDIYGNDATPYASDCAVLLFGMLQHLTHVRTRTTEEEIDMNEIVTFTLRRIDSIMPSMIETEDWLLGNELFEQPNVNHTHAQTKQKLLKQLTEFYGALKSEETMSGKEFLAFLLDEINSESPRVFLLETITRSFREAFIGTAFELETQELASNVWRYLDMLKS